MIPANSLTENAVRTIPCMVNNHGSGPTDGSTSGVLLFASPGNLSVYVLSVYSPTEDISASKKYILFDQNISDTDIFFIIGESSIRVRAAPLVAWSCEKFGFMLREVFQPKHHWSFASYDSSSDDGGKSRNEEALSWFILYKVNEGEMRKMKSSKVENFSSICSSFDLRVGMAVTTRSYPFGPDVMEIFTDTRSLGIVSNVTKSGNGTLFLTDARCLPGSEGGGVYISRTANQPSFLVGMIVTPLCRKTRELVGFTVCCSMQDVFQSLRNLACHLKQPNIRLDVGELCAKVVNTTMLNMHSNSRSEPRVVRVDSGGIWGTGVVVAVRVYTGLCEAIIATCQHVVESNNGTVCVTFEGSEKRHKATVLFATEENSAYDIAILSLHADIRIVRSLFDQHMPEGDQSIFTIKYHEQTSDYAKGSPVFIKGYPLFDVESGLGPSLSRGVLSNVIIHCGSVVLLHSTCLVHKGSSGGGLFCSQDGGLLGIIVNHVKDDENKISYPDVNFIIPCNVFMPAIERYLKFNDESALCSLNCYDKEVIRIWSLTPQKIESRL